MPETAHDDLQGFAADQLLKTGHRARLASVARQERFDKREMVAQTIPGDNLIGRKIPNPGTPDKVGGSGSAGVALTLSIGRLGMPLQDAGHTLGHESVARDTQRRESLKGPMSFSARRGCSRLRRHQRLSPCHRHR